MGPYGRHYNKRLWRKCRVAWFDGMSTARLASLLFCIINLFTFSPTAHGGNLSFPKHVDRIVKEFPTTLHLGETFDANQLPIGSKKTWYRVPRWLAGEWERTVEVVKQPDGESRTELSHRKMRVGCRVDSKKRIWDYVQIPDLQTIATSQNKQYKLILDKSIYAESNTSIAFRILSQTYIVNESDKIVDIYQEEHFVRYEPVTENILAANASTHHYDIDGYPILNSTVVSSFNERRIRDFSSANSCNTVQP